MDVGLAFLRGAVSIFDTDGMVFALRRPSVTKLAARSYDGSIHHEEFGEQ